MFDIWRKIAEKGTVAVPVKASALSALGWVEVGEKWPELIPEEFRHHDVYSDPQLIWKSPFVCEDDKQYLFVATDPSLGKTLKVSIGYNELLGALGAEDYYNDYEASFFMGILTCSCGDPGCAGINYQTCHVSDRMVHWSIKCYGELIDLFFERRAYEIGAVRMLKDMVENPARYSEPGREHYEGDHKGFVDRVYGMLERKPYFRDIWDEIVAQEAKA